MQDNHCHLNLSSFNCMIIYTCADAFYYHNEGILKRETNKYTSSNNSISRSGGLRVINLYKIYQSTAQLEFLNHPSTTNLTSLFGECAVAACWSLSSTFLNFPVSGLQKLSEKSFVQFEMVAGHTRRSLGRARSTCLTFPQFFCCGETS